MFTTRHMSSMIFVGVVVNSLEMAYFVLLTITNDDVSLARTAWLFLLIQTCVGLGMWVVAGLQLMMNNPFMPRFASSLIACLLLANCCNFIYAMLTRFFHPEHHPFATGIIFLEPQTTWYQNHWFRFLIVLTQLCVLLVLLLRLLRPVHSSDYLQIELRALHYTSLLSKVVRPRTWPHVGEKVEVRINDQWKRGAVKEEFGNGMVGVLVEDTVDKFGNGKNVQVLRKRCRPIGRPEHELSSATRVQRSFLDFLRPVVIMPPVLSLAGILGIILTTWASCIVASNASITYRKAMKLTEVSSLLHDYIFLNYTSGKLDCDTTGLKLAAALDFDSSGNLSIGELPGIPGDVFVRYQKMPNIVCGIEKSVNATKGLVKKFKDGTATGKDVDNVILIVYHEILYNTYGPEVERNITEQIMSGGNNAQQHINEQIKNAEVQAEQQIQKGIQTGIDQGKTQLDMLYDKGLASIGSAGSLIRPGLSLFGINSGSDLVPGQYIAQIQDPAYQKQVMDQALNMLVEKMYGGNGTAPTAPTANELYEGMKKITPADIEEFALSMAMNHFPKNASATEVQNGVAVFAHILEQTLYWLGHFWVRLGFKAIYVIGACCNVTSEVFVLYLVGRMFRKYHTLMQTMQQGKFDLYERHSMRNSYGACTYLPGTFVFSSIMAYFVSYVVLFVLLVLLVVLIVLLIIPQTREMIFNWAIGKLIYLSLYLVIVAGTRLVVIEKYCIEEGEVVRPVLLSFCLTVLLVYNFVVGLGIAIFRIQFTLMHAFVNGLYLDGTILPSWLMAWDTGYSSFLASTYTWYETINPIKKSFISVIMPKVHMTFYDDKEYHQSSVRKRRVRNKLNLALTLFRNPEIQEYRRHG
jgi:hypothetical protein